MDGSAPNCTNSGTSAGTVTAPFCAIQAAADVVQPGQTVLIGGLLASYDEDVAVKTSGTSTAPITFAAASAYFTVGGQDHAFTLTGVSNIVIKGLYAATNEDSVLISGSSNITVEGSHLRQGASSSAVDFAGVHVTGASSAVRIERSRIENSSGGSFGTGIRVDGGSTGTVVATNYLDSFGQTGIAVAGATGTDVVGNTLVGGIDGICGPGISVTAGSSSTVVENNVVTGLSPNFAGAPTCSSGGPIDLLVSADSASATTERYNVLPSDPAMAEAATPAYEWAGNAYFTVASFQAAAPGEGTQDVVPASVDLSSTAAIPASSPLIDSADANAPGETSTDIYGNPRVDDPSVANSGTGPGYYDRGAIEYQEYTSGTMTLSLQSAQHVDAEINLKGIPWGFVSESFDWGDGTKSQFSGTSTDMSVDFTTWFGNDHMYTSPGAHTITETLTDAAGTKTLTGTISTIGSTYAPVTPTRVLDTRHGIGTGGVSAPVPAGSSIAFSVTSGVAGAPAPSSITAVVLNVTVTAPATGGYITAYPDGSSRPTSSNLNFSAAETVPNLVTVKIGADGKVALYNGSSGTAHLVADVEGYYIAGPAGSGFVPVSPVRLLDTRNGTGTSGSTNPVPAGATLSLKIEGNGPVPAAAVTAVVLNVTVTRPTAGGYITVYPGGTTLPKASNLNFSAGETVPNLVIVPVGKNGAVNFANGSPGTVALVADVSGYYTATGGDAFVPVNPIRMLDTRTGFGQESAPHPVAANGDQFIDVGLFGGDMFEGAALVLNVTVTEPTAGGYITVYPYGTTLPTVSNLNFSPGETVPNLAITKFHGSLAVLLHNGSAGPTNLVADVFGYFS